MQKVEGFQHLAANNLNLGLGEASVQLWKPRELVNSASIHCQQLTVRPTHIRYENYNSHQH